MPAALVEIGFVTEKSETRSLQDPNVQQRIAVAVLEAVSRFVRTPPRRGPTDGPLAGASACHKPSHTQSADAHNKELASSLSRLVVADVLSRDERAP
jgi:hypothetical protein